MIHDVKPFRMLETAFERKIPLVLSFLSDYRWSVARGLITAIGEDSFSIRLTPQRSGRPSGIKRGLKVGASFKYGYGGSYDKFIFDTTVMDTAHLQPVITLAIPQQIEMVPRRSFQRVNVPDLLEVRVHFCHRYCVSDGERTFVGMGPDRQGRLIDISAAGMQFAIDASEKHDFSKGQFVNIRFAPMPGQTELVLSGRIKNILPTADGRSICFGLEVVGLEASPEGRLVLSRLVGLVEQYNQMSALQNSSNK